MARTVGPGAGLVAATEVQSQLPTWIVTGGSTAAVQAAAGAVDKTDLAHRFAIVVNGPAKVSVPVR